MRLANLGGRATLVVPSDDDRGVDIAEISGSKFGPEVKDLYDEWDAFGDFAADRHRPGPDRSSRAELRQPGARDPGRCSPSASTTAATPRSRAWTLPEVPATFTKFPASLAGPFDDIEHRRRHRRLGGRARRRHRPPRRPRRRGRRLDPRRRAHRRPGHQRPHAPVRRRRAVLPRQVAPRATARIGPWVVTLDECDDPDDLALGCSVDGETVQDARTSDLVFGVPQTRSPSCRPCCPLLPGDIIFTGTPGGRRRHPQAAPIPAARRDCSRRGSRASAPSATGSPSRPER